MAEMLGGLKVLEMGHAIAVPAAGAMMADWGAEVIKVEPLTGDMHRGLRRTLGVDRVIKYDGGEVNWVIEVMNRNKKGLALDLKREEGKDILGQLVKETDVFMSNYEVGALKKLGLDYASLSRLNPRLIYAIITGYGTVGPDKDERGFDMTAAWARSGMQHQISQPGSPPPLQRPGTMDRVTGAYLVSGIVTALLHRERTGEGQELECSLYHTAVWAMALDIQGALVGLPLPRSDRTRASGPLANTYQSKDGRWFMFVMVRDEFWVPMCRVIERPDLENDPRFNTMEMREQNCEELIRILDEIFATRNRDEWEKRLKENNCIYGLVQTPLEVIADPQALANNFFAEINHPAIGEMKLVTTPVEFHQNPASIKTTAPELGQHTEEILLGLGYGWDDIVQLKDKQVIL